MDPGLLAVAYPFDDGHLFVAAVVSAAMILLTSGRKTSRRCHHCRQTNREEAIYCAQCGRRLGG